MPVQFPSVALANVSPFSAHPFEITTLSQVGTDLPSQNLFGGPLATGQTPPLDVLPSSICVLDAQTLASLSFVSTALGNTGLTSDSTLTDLDSEPQSAGLGDTLVDQPITLFGSGTPRPIDVVQHQLGDCYLDSVLAGLAATPQGQATIKNAITATGSTPPSYTVHMYAPDGSPVDVSVDSLMDSDGVTNAQGQMDWASVMEKAYAKYNDTYHVTGSGSGYAGIANGGTSDVVMQAFTGRAASSTNLSSMSATSIQSTLAADLASGKVVTAGTNSGGTLADGTQIVGDHAYTVESVNADGSLTLRNPWGYDPGVGGDGTITITAQDFQQYFGVAWAG